MTTDTENMPGIALDQDLTLILDSWDADHCESPHRAPLNRNCDHIPVAIYSCSGCHTAYKGCQSQIRYFLSRLDDFTRCRDCNSITAQTWKVTPL